jgi:16S rRNA (guanine527-N7)-methyltransferase
MSINHGHLQILTDGAVQLGVSLSDAVATQLMLYLEELLRWSPKIDLVSQTDPKEVIRKHFLDSLAVVPFLSEKRTLLDLGSGAGFPGLPIAIALPQNSVSLVEVRRKRISFLKEVVREIKATNITVYEGRAEALAENPFLYGKFAVVITRATWKVGTYLRYAVPFLEKTGIAIAMQGPQSDPQNFHTETLKNVPSFRLSTSHEYTLPFGSEKRRLLIFTQRCFT